jgi:WD40 repeat protein
MKTDNSGKVTGSFVVYGGPPLTQVSSLSFSADGKLLAVGGTPNFVEVWDIENQRKILGFAGGSNVALTPDGKVLVTDGKDIRLWGVPSGELLRTIKWTGEMIRRFSFSPDGTKLLVSSNGNDDAVFAIPAGERMATLKNTQQGQFSKDGLLIVGGNAKHILIWSTKDWSLIRDLSNGPDYVTHFAVDPKEDLAVVGGPNTARLVRLGSGEEVGKLGQGYTNFAAYSKDGSLVLTYPSSGFGIWDRTGKQQCRISELGNGTMAVSGDDRWLAAPPVGSGDVMIWKIQTLLTACNVPSAHP